MTILQWVVVFLFIAYIVYNIIPTIPEAQFDNPEQTVSEFYGSPSLDGQDRLKPTCKWKDGRLHC